MRHEVEEFAVAAELGGVMLDAAGCTPKAVAAPKRHRLRPGGELGFRTRDAELRTLAIQESERRRIASELHDGLGQMLTVLLLELRNAKAALAGCIPDSPTGISLDRAAAEARKAIAELRRSVMALYPSILDDLGLIAGLSCLVRDVCQAEPGLSFESNLSIDDTQVPRALHIVIFRIVQEAVNNVVKHAGASQLTLTLRAAGPILLLAIQDDGRGIRKRGDAIQGNRSGMAGITRRAQLSGGELTIRSCPESGTCVTVTWPHGGAFDTGAIGPAF